MSKTKRKQINYEEKSRIISKLESGVPNKVLVKEYGVSHSTISTIWKEREKIKTLYDQIFLKRKRARTTKHTNIEEALLKWFKYQKTNNVLINGPILQQKANDFAQLFGEDFVCSSSWIQRFRARHGVVYGSMKPKRKSSDIRREFFKAKLIDAELEKKSVAEPLQSYEKTEDFEKELIFNAVVKKEAENTESDVPMLSDIIMDDINICVREKTNECGSMKTKRINSDIRKECFKAKLINAELEKNSTVEVVQKEAGNMGNDVAMPLDIILDEKDNCVREKTNNCDSMKSKRKNCDIKHEYFKAKLRNTKLKNKYLINKNKIEINKYKMQIEILKLRLKKLKSIH